jgi:hypothetical protein
VLLSSGEGSGETTETMLRVADAFGLAAVDVDITFTAITICCPPRHGGDADHVDAPGDPPRAGPHPAGQGVPAGGADRARAGARPSAAALDEA